MYVYLAILYHISYEILYFDSPTSFKIHSSDKCIILERFGNICQSKWAPVCIVLSSVLYVWDIWQVCHLSKWFVIVWKSYSTLCLQAVVDL